VWSTRPGRPARPGRAARGGGAPGAVHPAGLWDRERELRVELRIPFAITRYEKRAIWTFFLVCLTESPKNWWGAPIGLSTVLGSLGMAHWTVLQALLEL
jgi:hypothetical protein